jgi:hypothetical protein
MKSVKSIWKRWLKIAKVIGNFQAQILFTVFYFLILWMVGIMRFFSDPLRLKKTTLHSNFITWEHPVETIEQARKQY